jgi:chaperonin GroES
MEHGQKIESPVKVGDTVIYKKWGGNELKVGEVEYQFLKFDDILAIVKK